MAASGAPRPPGALGEVPTHPTLLASYHGEGSPPAQPAPPPLAAASSLSSAANAPPPAVPLAKNPSGEADDEFVHVGPPPADPKPLTPRASLATEAASPTGSPTASCLSGSAGAAPSSPAAPPSSALPPVSAKQLAPQPSPTPGGPDEDPVSAASLAYLLAQKTYKVVQHFVIRSPHMFVSISVTFYVCKFFGDEPYAWEAATFVGVASAVHCLIKPLFLMLIPYSLLPRKANATWRTFINATNTILITISLSTAVWGLKIPAWQGTAIWVGSFGVPYGFLSKQYPDIDAQFPDANKESPLPAVKA